MAAPPQRLVCATQELIVPRKRTGVILGPGGQTASDIRRQCRCQLHVRKDTRPDDTQTVEISGSLQQVWLMTACVPQCAGDGRP